MLPDDNWDEATATYNGANPYSPWPATAVNLDLYTIDLAPVYGTGGESYTSQLSNATWINQLQAEIDTSDYAHTLQLYMTSSGADTFSVFTKEHATAGYHPYMTVEYTPEPMTMTMLGLGGLALLRRRRA